jgi:hypothetical protein
VQNLAKVLGIPTAYFYSEDENLAAFIMLFGRMNTEDCNELLNYANSLVAE